MLPFSELKKITSCSFLTFIAGCYLGYTYSNTQADVERQQLITTALKAENENLIKQIKVEREKAKQAQISAEQVKADVSAIEDKYNSALADFERLQFSDDNHTAALPPVAPVANSIPESKCKCGGNDQRKLQRLYERELIKAKDCDINSAHLNALIDWYHSISK